MSISKKILQKWSKRFWNTSILSVYFCIIRVRLGRPDTFQHVTFLKNLVGYVYEILRACELL